MALSKRFMWNWRYLFHYCRFIKTTGAFFPHSEKIGRVLCDIIRNYCSDVSILVEYGPGTGNITRHLLALPLKSFVAYEIDQTQSQELVNLFANYPGFRLITKGAECVSEDFAPESVDCIVSTIPFSLLGDKKTTILTETARVLRPGGYFLSAQYSPISHDLFCTYIGPQIARDWVRDVMLLFISLHQKPLSCLTFLVLGLFVFLSFGVV